MASKEYSMPYDIKYVNDEGQEDAACLNLGQILRVDEVRQLYTAYHKAPYEEPRRRLFYKPKRPKYERIACGWYFCVLTGGGEWADTTISTATEAEARRARDEVIAAWERYCERRLAAGGG